MQYSQLFSLITEHLARNPAPSPTLQTHFINMALNRIERRLRLNFQINTNTLTLIDNKATLPADLISFVQVSDENGYIPRVSPLTEDVTRGFFVIGNDIWTSHDAETVTIEYYSQLTTQTPTSTNTQLGANIPDLVIYATLIYLAEHYKDERQTSFTNTFEILVAEYEAAERLAKLSGKPVVRNPYEGLF